MRTSKSSLLESASNFSVVGFRAPEEGRAGLSARVRLAIVSARSDAVSGRPDEGTETSLRRGDGLMMEDMRFGIAAGLMMTEDDLEGMETLLEELRMEAERA